MLSDCERFNLNILTDEGGTKSFLDALKTVNSAYAEIRLNEWRRDSPYTCSMGSTITADAGIPLVKKNGRVSLPLSKGNPLTIGTLIQPIRIAETKCLSEAEMTALPERNISLTDAPT
jgi:hypothetical protein